MADETPSWDVFMDHLADKFRGPTHVIASQQRERYLAPVGEVVHQCGKPVLDIGCGRGEWLRVLQEEGIPATGIELNDVQVERCLQAGLDVVKDDAFRFLDQTPAGSWAVITALQVVEHWPPEMVWKALLSFRRALAPGGLLILETVNVSSVWAWNHFSYDPTHRSPWPPDLLAFMTQEAGFSSSEVRYYAPVPIDYQLPILSHGWERVSYWLYGFQDYAVWARP